MITISQLIVLVLLTTLSSSLPITGVVAQTNTTSTTSTTPSTPVAGHLEVLRLTQIAMNNLTDEPLNATKTPERLQIEALISQDPTLKTFEDIMNTCATSLMARIVAKGPAYTPEQKANATAAINAISQSQCVSTLSDATEKWCSLDAYDAVKCEYVRNVESAYKFIQEMASFASRM